MRPPKVRASTEIVHCDSLCQDLESANIILVYLGARTTKIISIPDEKNPGVKKTKKYPKSPF